MAIGARKQPLYDQLVDILTEKIDHEYRAGDMIPSERELSERYGLSRTTVRLALQELERLGLVVRQHGRGTFVTDRSAKATNLMQSYSFTEQMRAMGREPETTILEFCEMEADKNLAEHMGLRIGDRIFKLKRLALQELERLGLVVRQHGRGTFVTDRSAKATNLMQSYSFTEQMRAMGREPETTILEFCEMEADKNLAEHMGLRIGDRIFKLKRLRSADNMPMMVERSYLPVRQFLSLKRPLLERKPLYDVIEQDFQQKIRVAEEEFYASIARPTDAHLLGIVEGSPVLDLVRTTYNESNEVVEYTLSVARADQFKYKVYHQRSN